MGKDSEYRYQFGSKWDKHSAAYDDNLELRYVRRSAEYNHHGDAFVWDEREWWDADSVLSVGARPLSGVPIHKYKHEKFNQAYHDRVVQYEQQKKQLRNRKLNTDPAPPTPTPEHEKQARIREQEKQASEHSTPTSFVIKRPESRNAMVQVNGWMSPSITPSTPSQIRAELAKTPVADQATQTDSRNPTRLQQKIRNSGHIDKDKSTPVIITKPGLKVSRPVKPVRYPGFSVMGPKQPTRPHTAPGGSRAPKKPPSAPKQPPFLAFGYRNKEREVGAKKTHNVKAAAEVYPSALRAQRRMQFMMDRIEEEARNASSYEKRKKALFNDRTKMSGWDTEYRRSYVGYDDEKYERATSARAYPIRNPSAFFIPA